ncbi:MAG TPA: hypothetical protein VFY29_09290, partial [Terriglobia bacterium]|nr:hypothetical protein [Terriglobia bacterium]
MSRYRQLMLLVAALILPAIVITAMGWRIIAQERDLAERTARERWDDAQKRALMEIRQYIAAQLDRIKYQESTAAATGTGAYSDPAVKLVAGMDRDKLALPWEFNPNKERFRRALEDPEFQRQIAEAERAEFGDRGYDRAGAIYRHLAAAGRNESQRLWARFLLARALWQAGARDEAAAIDRDLLKLPSSVVDDIGLPFETYAAWRLAEGRVAGREILNRLNQDLSAGALAATISPAGAAEWKRILETLSASKDVAVLEGAASASERLTARLRELDQAQALQADFSDLHLGPAEWQLYGEPPWLIGLGSPAAGSPTPVIAVQASDILAGAPSSVEIPGLQFQIGSDLRSGEPLGAD